MLYSIFAVLGGLVALFFGGELLVRGAVGLSEKFGLPPLVTGIVVVGAATSMPEMVASIEAARQGSPEIAWGNVIGSNIANSLLILGATAVIAPIVLHGVGKRDALVGLAAAGALWLATAMQIGSSWLGAGFLAALVLYIIWRIKHLPDTRSVDDVENAIADNPVWWLAIVQFLAGLAVLIGGGQFLVSGAINLAQMAGISETVIGLTVVAIGTSFPELAASAAAAWRGHSELAIGNVVGSNLYNLLLIGGVTMVIAPNPVPAELLAIQWPVLAAATMLVLLLCWFAKRIGRGLGVVLLAGFAANTALVFAL